MLINIIHGKGKNQIIEPGFHYVGVRKDKEAK